MTRNNKLSAATLITIFSVSVILVTVLVLLVQAFYLFGVQREFERKELSGKPAELFSFINQQKRQLEGDYQVLGKNDDGSPIVHVPIDRAMSLVVQELKQGGR